MDYRSLLPKAIAMATLAHGTAINKDGTPYILHPLRLMMQADGYAQQIVAVLHDTLEDTALTTADLTDQDFPDELISSVKMLTKIKGEDYDAFIERIATDPLAAKVKLLDLYDNIDVTRLPELGDWELRRTAKYHRAILRLRQALD